MNFDLIELGIVVLVLSRCLRIVPKGPWRG